MSPKRHDKTQRRNSDSLLEKISFDDSAFLKNLTFEDENELFSQKAIYNPEGPHKSSNSLAKIDSKKQKNETCSSKIKADTVVRGSTSAKNTWAKRGIPNHVSIENNTKKQISRHKIDNGDIGVKEITKNGRKISCNGQILNNIQSNTNKNEQINFEAPNTVLAKGKDVSMNKKLLPDIKSTKITEVDVVSNQKYKLSDWGLPDIILRKYEDKKIKNMFQWQYECLSNPKVLNDMCNLIYSAPTSAGKTLVSEILALKTIFERKKKVIFILPFVSIVREKMYYFQDILGSSGVRVEGFMGSYNPPGGFSSINFAICTIEKANSLINRLMEEGRLSEIGAVLVDEMHLLGDPHRGYLLELLLTKVRYISLKDVETKIQIIGMSATLPNLPQLAKWLGAELYATSFRPIPLHEQALVCSEVYDRNLKFVRKLETLPDIGVDTDNILQLCLETIQDSCSVLIFCSSKNWCENLAQQLAQAFFKLGNSQTPFGELLRTQIKPESVMEVLEQLKFCPVSLDPILRQTVSFGIAFHHAGLTMDERDIIEGGFRSGCIKILVATSTLSSGVNLPARRVLIRSPNFYGKSLDLLTYRQMIGRAGRMGKDIKGESFLICQKSDYKTAKELMSGELPAVESCLEGSGKLKKALLEAIASGVSSTPDDVDLFMKCTLLSVTNSDTDFQDIVEETLNFLKEHEFIRLQKTCDLVEKYMPTSLGKACLSSSISPDEGLALFTELEKARQCFVLETELHLIYLVTPYSACHSWGNIDWMFYLELWDKLSPSMKKVGQLVGVRESCIVNATRGKFDQSTSKAYHKLLVHKRFFVSLALQDLVNEVPLSVVCTKFNCNRGMLQSLQQSSSTFSGMLTSFSRQLGWTSVELLLDQFQNRMQFGVSRDLLDLMRLSSLNGKLARTLYNAGIETVIQLANHEVDYVENILCRAGPFESTKERDGETEYHNKQRNKLRTVWITGKEGLTEREAAELLVQEARTYLQTEMGLSDAKWSPQNGSNYDNDTRFVDSSQANNDNMLSSDIGDVSPGTIKSNSQIEISNSSGSITLHLSTDEENDQGSAETHTTVSLVNVNSDSFSNVEIEQDTDKKTGTSEIKPSPRVLLETTSNSSFSELSFTRIEGDQIVEDPTKNDSTSAIPENVESQWEFESMLKDTDLTSIIAKHSDDNNHEIEEDCDDFDMEGSFESAMQNVDFTQEIIKSRDPFHESTNTKTSDVPQVTTEKSSPSHNAKRNCVSTSQDSEEDILKCSPLKRSKLLDTFKNSFNSPQVSKKVRSIDNFEQLHIIEVCRSDDLIKIFIEEVKLKRTFSFSVICSQVDQENKPTIGAKVLGISNERKSPTDDLCYDSKKIQGFAFCWGNAESYFLSIEVEETRTMILMFLKEIFEDSRRLVRIFGAKGQMKFLKNCCQLDFDCQIEDPKVGDWLIDAEDEEKGLNIMASQYCPNLEGISRLCFDKSTIGSLGLYGTKNHVVRGSVEVVLTWYLADAVREKLGEQMPKVYESYIPGVPSIYDLEMRTLKCLANMEVHGMSVNEKLLQDLAALLKVQQRAIEKVGYSFTGRTFNFNSNQQLSSIMGLLNIKKVGTKKQDLQQMNHPFANIVLLWRKIYFTLVKIVYPMIKACKDNRIYGIYHTHTATGRLIMYEPSIQMVTKDFTIENPVTKQSVLISCRSCFSSPDGYILVSADYAQLELRVLTYLSKDKLLVEVMNKPGDIFKALAAKWNGVTENMVDDTMRQNTKKLCYGIIYGMGSRSLGEQMDISTEDAQVLMETFRNTYSGMKVYTDKVIELCRKNGYVETLSGRRRYLPNINSTDHSTSNHAQRQAINTTIQGSAADIIKNAMITIEDKMNTVFEKSRYKPKLTLHLHDELIYEVPHKYLEKTIKIIKRGMENSAKVFGRFPVKVKVGKSWGELVEYVHDL